MSMTETINAGVYAYTQYQRGNMQPWRQFAGAYLTAKGQRLVEDELPNTASEVYDAMERAVMAGY